MKKMISKWLCVLAVPLWRGAKGIIAFRGEELLKVILLCMVTVLSSVSQAGAQKKYMKEGNKLYKEHKYKQADTSYVKALAKNPANADAMFNLGNSQYQQKQYEQSRKLMEASGKNFKGKEQKSATDYNIGNTYMEEKKWQEAVDAYKQALRKNPRDADAKYNLSYALNMLKQQQNQDKNNKDKKNQDKDNKDQNKDNKDQQDKKESQDKKDQDNKGGDKDKEQQKKEDQQKQNEEGKEDEQDKKQQPMPSKLSEQQAAQLLNALQQEEKKLQGKLQKAKGVPVKVEKDW